MKISSQGISLIKHFESLHDGDLSQIGLQPKMDPLGIWTVGYGHALKVDGEFLRGEADKEKAYTMFPNLTEEKACELLDQDCNERECQVERLDLNLSQNEFDALVSFVYNVGFRNLYNSSLLKFVSSADWSEEDIKWAFSLWNKGRENGILKVLPGLTKRRKSEAELFLTGNLIFT
jgi:lysozyme